MNKPIYKLEQLPLADLARIGLADENKVLLDEDDLNALLSGRRSDMLRLENLKSDGLVIPALDAKLSLRQRENGELELLVHPIYKELEPPFYLTKLEAQSLEKGEVSNISKFITDSEGRAKEVLVEFDKETNEFIITDTEQILAPDGINGIKLTPEQKERYRKGKEVVTEDGTTLQYSANEKQGIRSDKLALIASVLIDGGVSYILYKGLHALFGEKEQEEKGKNFDKALDQLTRRPEQREAVVSETISR